MKKELDYTNYDNQINEDDNMNKEKQIDNEDIENIEKLDEQLQDNDNDDEELNYDD